MKDNWNRFLLAFTFMTGHMTDINVIVSVCALNLRIKFCYLLF